MSYSNASFEGGGVRGERATDEADKMGWADTGHSNACGWMV